MRCNVTSKNSTTTNTLTSAKPPMRPVSHSNSARTTLKAQLCSGMGGGLSSRSATTASMSPKSIACVGVMKLSRSMAGARVVAGLANGMLDTLLYQLEEVLTY